MLEPRLFPWPMNYGKLHPSCLDLERERYSLAHWHWIIRLFSGQRIRLSFNEYYYTFNSLSLFSLTESAQWSREFSKSAPRTSFSRRLYNNHVMDTQGHHEATIFSFRSMYNKTIISFGCCDIQNNQGLFKGYQH